MMDSADPETSWPLLKIWENHVGAAKNDFYGKLFFYLQERFQKFIQRLRKSKFKFTILRKDVLELPGCSPGFPLEVAWTHFDRGPWVAGFADELLEVGH